MKQELAAKEISWIQVSEPTNEELAEFVRETHLSAADAEFIVQNHYRPEIATRDGYVLFLLEVPTFDKKTRVTQGVPLYVLVTSSRIWTLHYDPIPALEKITQDFIDTPARQEEYFSDSPLSLVLYIINLLHNFTYQKLERLRKQIDIVSDAVFHGNERKMVEEIAVLRRDVMDFRSVMRPQASIFDTVPNHALITPELREPWTRLSGQLKRIWDMLEGLSENVQELSDTNEALLQHKENQLLRMLTIYSIVAIPALILVTPFNFPDVLVGSPLFFLFLSIFLIFTLILIWIFARFKDRKHG